MGSPMSTEELKPITTARVAQELTKLSVGRSKGEIATDEYEHRFARMIGELRDRRIDGNRAEILAALKPLKDDGTISLTDWDRLVRSLGLV
jgi:hypothetical protein